MGGSGGGKAVGTLAEAHNCWICGGGRHWTDLAGCYGQRSCGHTALGASWKAAGSGQELSHISFNLTPFSPGGEWTGQDLSIPHNLSSFQIDCHLLFLCGNRSRQEHRVLAPLGQEWCFLKTDPGAAKTRAGTRPDDISSWLFSHHNSPVPGSSQNCPFQECSSLQFILWMAVPQKKTTFPREL